MIHMSRLTPAESSDRVSYPHLDPPPPHRRPTSSVAPSSPCLRVLRVQLADAEAQASPLRARAADGGGPPGAEGARQDVRDVVQLPHGVTHGERRARLSSVYDAAGIYILYMSNNCSFTSGSTREMTGHWWTPLICVRCLPVCAC